MLMRLVEKSCTFIAGALPLEVTVGKCTVEPQTSKCPEPETKKNFLGCNRTIYDLRRTINDSNNTATV